jgi:hypothetical protein
MAMPVDLIMELIALTVLVGYLVFEQWRRARHSPDYSKGDPNIVGQGLDVEPMKPAMERLRHDFASAARAQPDLHFKSMLLHHFRQAVVRLDFFRDRIEEPDHSPAIK